MVDEGIEDVVEGVKTVKVFGSWFVEEDIEESSTNHQGGEANEG